LLKVQYEESHLVDHYPGYRDYMKRTKKLIPFIY
jgi:protein-S-isoprenylcysteine O-methyltransferase Ste14